MLFLTLLFLPFLSLLALAAPTPVDKTSRSYRFEPVRWLTHFPATIPPDTTLELSWQGGSGKGYEVYFIPQWEGQTEYYPVDITETKSTYAWWHTPKRHEWPEGTTFILAVNDIVGASGGAGWYDLTGLLSFAEDK